MLPYLRKSGGVIINVSSFGGLVALPFGSLYNSSKFAVEGFSESLSHELAPFNIANTQKPPNTWPGRLPRTLPPPSSGPQQTARRSCAMW